MALPIGNGVFSLTKEAHSRFSHILPRKPLCYISLLIMQIAAMTNNRAYPQAIAKKNFR